MNIKKRVITIVAILSVLCTSALGIGAIPSGSSEKSYIKYAEFNVTYEALKKAVDYDIQTYGDAVHLDCIELLSYLASVYGGDFSNYKSSDMEKLALNLLSGETIASLTKDLQYYNYYHEVYTAVLAEFIGEYSEDYTDTDGTVKTKTMYGLKVFSPIASTFPYSDYDDFGASRTYGYKRQHLGHDMMAATGTPVIAIESGTVECIGWNQYGGWRIGIRSFDKKRYYYYAHLRQNRPYHIDLQVNQTVVAGDVIGYVGRTGYSTTENTNGIEVSHLHLGLELVFDESQKESDNEIWINLYAITRLLSSHQSKVVRVAETKEFYRAYNFTEKSVPDGSKQILNGKL